MVKDQFEVWICFLHYTCEGAPGPLPGAQANSMCWVYNEARRLFVPWCEPLRPYPMFLVGFSIRPSTVITFMSEVLKGCCQVLISALTPFLNIQGLQQRPESLL
jgi:hypothetical protein